MCKTNAALFLSLLAVITSTNSMNSKIVYPARAKQNDVNSLIPLKPKQALPLILFQGEGKMFYQFPMGLTQVEIQDRRLASGTEFYTIPPSKQIFFCPFPGLEPKKMALFEVNYEKSKILECEYEPEPMIRPADENKVCGPIDNGGVSLEFIYRVMFGNILSPTKDKVKITTFPIYKLCYSAAIYQVVFIEYKTFSAKLHSEELLVREREIEFEGNLNTRYDDQIDPNYHDKLHKAIEEFPDYGFQKLLPPEYMALYSWRKSAYHYANVALQHKKLISLWSEIHTYINTNAIEMHQLPRTILTGLSPIPFGEFPKTQETQIHEIWVTLIMDTNVEDNQKGVAILMHNFVTEESENESGSTISMNQLYIDKICGQDICVKSLKQKFDAVNGQIRCCMVTQDIKKIFYWGIKDIEPINKVLEIRGITYDD